MKSLILHESNYIYFVQISVKHKRYAFVIIRQCLQDHSYFITCSCFDSMVHLIETESEDMYTYIKLFAHRLTMTPTPPPGRVAIVSNIATTMPPGRGAIVSMHSIPNTPRRGAIVSTIATTPPPGRGAILSTHNNNNPPPQHTQGVAIASTNSKVQVMSTQCPSLKL